MILIKKKVINGISFESINSYPYECCGLLSGKILDYKFDVSNYHPLENTSLNPLHEFKIDPISHISIQKNLRILGYKVIGVYHSHPNGSKTPSEKDVIFFNDSNFLWFIVSLNKNKESDVAVFRPVNNFSENFKVCSYKVYD